jgi:hypothetical protein
MAHHRMSLLLILYQLLRCLRGLTAVLRRDLSKGAELLVLRHTRSLDPIGRGKTRWAMRWNPHSTPSRSPSKAVSFPETVPV